MGMVPDQFSFWIYAMFVAPAGTLTQNAIVNWFVNSKAGLSGTDTKSFGAEKSRAPSIFPVVQEGRGTQLPLHVNVPLWLFPLESCAVVPEVSSNGQYATKPAAATSETRLMVPVCELLLRLAVTVAF